MKAFAKSIAPERVLAVAAGVRQRFGSPWYRVASNEYGKYCVPLSVVGRPAAEAVFGGRVYEPETVQFIRSHAGEGSVVHAGAFFGDFLPALATVLDAGAALWAFE